MSATVHVVPLAGHTASLNELTRGKLRDRMALTRRDRDWVGYSCRMHDVPPAQGKRRVSCRVVLGPGQRGCDPDAYWKSLLDALVAAGALTSDAKEGVVLGEVTFERGLRPAMWVTLEDMSDG